MSGNTEKMAELFGPNPKIAIVCRGGPENGPYTAMAARIITEVLSRYNFKISGIYTCSGSVSTGLLGCVGDYARLCNIWLNITPQDIVGKVKKFKTIYRIIQQESFFSDIALKKMIKGNWDLDRIFSSEAILIKFPAVDALASKYIVFSNKNPKHKKWFAEGVLGSKAIIPFLPPQVIYNPEDADLIEKGRSRTIDGNDWPRPRLMKPSRHPYKASLLIDGGYMGNMLLEEAQRDGFNVIFLIDIHGLQPTETDLSMRRHWSSYIRIGQHILSNTNDNRQYQNSERINEEIKIKGRLIELADKLPPEYAQELNSVIDQMNEGRLRLGDKAATQIHMVSNGENSSLFNFAKFEQQDVVNLMSYAWEAAVDTLNGLGFDTSCVMPGGK